MPLDEKNLNDLGFSPQNIEFLRGLDETVPTKRYFNAQALAAEEVPLFTATETINDLAILVVSQSGSPTLAAWITTGATSNDTRFASAFVATANGAVLNVPKMKKNDILIVEPSDTNITVQDIDR
ncbi:hypothetical protein KAR91_12830 [Candidatus Pacearchaeota archaeon]|nr:hypothetical protein [Candidatus Pacearchaeota archaeon]